MIKNDHFGRPCEGFKMGMGIHHGEDFRTGIYVQGHVFFDMRDAQTGRNLHAWDRKNLIVLDAGILAARLFKDPLEPAHGINMLAVGSGATGSLLSPDAPDSRQRRLNVEIERKAFSSTTFRDASGNAVSIPTNIVDFTTVFGEAEAVGPLNEMGLLSTISANPSIKADNPDIFPARDVTVDVSVLDILANYLSFSVISKPSTAILTITWRLTF